MGWKIVKLLLFVQPLPPTSLWLSDRIFHGAAVDVPFVVGIESGLASEGSTRGLVFHGLNVHVNSVRTVLPIAVAQQSDDPCDPRIRIPS